MNKEYSNLTNKHLHQLCNKIINRSVGSPGNREATSYFEKNLSKMGWETITSEFQAMDWNDGGADLTIRDQSFEVFVSPYAPACSVKSELTQVSSISQLESVNARDKILFIHGKLATEQLMPKNFVFYNPDRHQKIISLLESSGAQALICATSRNAGLAGGVYPFPLIEDGDFEIPSVYMTEDEGQRLLSYAGQVVNLKSNSERIPGKGFNVIGRKNTGQPVRIVITAHIDAKKGSPGAIDNATGVTILLLLAKMLSDYSGSYQIELVALNGEDYYAVPGQMLYLAQNHGKFEQILLNINIDGAGYKEGGSVFSFFNLPPGILKKVKEVMANSNEITEGPYWPQGDHSIFIQKGIPALAVSSKWFIDHIEDQEITHTPKDNISIVNEERLVEIGKALNTLIRLLL